MMTMGGMAPAATIVEGGEGYDANHAISNSDQ
jgi:hypothetical protein